VAKRTEVVGLIVVGAVLVAIAAWALMTVPPDHGRALLAVQEGEVAAECLIEQVSENWPRPIIGPWAIERVFNDDDRFRVYGAFGQAWEFWRSEGTLSTTGVRGTIDFGSSTSCR